jgi:hypothetical protein
MKHFDFLPTPIFRWMLDFPLTSRLQFVSIQGRFAQIAFFAGFWLALVSFLVVQCLQTHLQEGGFVLAGRLKFQVARLPS